MKDFVQIWNSVTGRRYSAVNTADRELRDLSNSPRKKGQVDTSTFEANFTECESLNNKFNEDVDFNDRRHAIINRLFEKRRKGQVARQPKCLFVLLLFGFMALSTGCFILFLQPYDFLFKQKIVFTEGGEIFEMWRKPEVDLFVKIYLFNVTNAQEFLAGNDTKLKMKEVGPYTYKEGLEHKIQGFNKSNGTLSAIPRHPLTWVGELSEGNREDDILFLPHIALLSIANVVSSQSIFTRFALNNLITVTKSQPLVQMTAREFMMGYKSNLMTLGNTFMPTWIYFDKLGLIDRMYDFEGDYETIFTGENNVHNAGLIDTYKGSTDLPQWEGKHCSNVQYASDGTKFKGGVGRNESILFFRKSLCRAAPLVPVKEGMKSGLKSYMYTLPEHLFDNGEHIEENKCFCRKGKCLPEGLIDVTDCYYGFPIALSHPHFYQGAEVLSSKVEGLAPNQKQHETRFWIQPETGLPLDVSAKFQINMALGDISKITHTEKFADMYLPLLWFDIRMYRLTDRLESRFNMYLNVLPYLVQALMYIMFAVGVILITLTVYRLTFKVMFKTFDKKNRNIRIGTEVWIEKEKNRRPDSDDIYAPCEVPLNGSCSESDEPMNVDRKASGFIMIKEFRSRLGDKVYDSIGSVKGVVRDEFAHVRNIFADKERKNSLIPPQDDSNTNAAYKSDSDSDERFTRKDSYRAISQEDSDCEYLEVMDDGSGFDNITIKMELEISNELNRLDGDKYIHSED